MTIAGFLFGLTENVFKDKKNKITPKKVLTYTKTVVVYKYKQHRKRSS